ncbi:MAG: hypothetical protein ACPLVI_08080 [Thermoplasmata archaeon]|jgi:hypothetical protein
MKKKYMEIITPIIAILIILLYFSTIYNPYPIKTVEENDTSLTINIPNNITKILGLNVNITSNKSVTIINNIDTLSTYIWATLIDYNNTGERGYWIIFGYYVDGVIRDSFNPGEVKFIVGPVPNVSRPWLVQVYFYSTSLSKNVTVPGGLLGGFINNTISKTYTFYINQSSHIPRSFQIFVGIMLVVKPNLNSTLSYTIPFIASIPGFSKPIQSKIFLTVIKN